MDKEMNPFTEARLYLQEALYDAWRWEIPDWSYKTCYLTNTVKFNVRLIRFLPPTIGSKSIYIPCIRNGVNLRIEKWPPKT